MLKIGVIGVGRFGKNHARILANNPACELVGIYDKKIKTAAKVATELETFAFADLDELLEKIDAVVIVVTTTFHYEIAKKALLKGVHIFIEKPITSELWQAEELVKLAAEKNLKIQVGHIERFNPIIMQIADKIENPVFVECHRIAPFTARATDVPVILDMMIHDLDLILSFVKSKVENIQAIGSGVMTKNIDIANARLEFTNGAVANITSSRISMKSSRKIRIFQKDSYFSVDFQQKKATYIKKSKHLYKVLPKILLGKFENINTEDVVDIRHFDAENQTKDALTVELEAFLNVVEFDINPLVDGKAGAKALEIAYQIMEKIKGKN